MCDPSPTNQSCYGSSCQPCERAGAPTSTSPCNGSYSSCARESDGPQREGTAGRGRTCKEGQKTAQSSDPIEDLEAGGNLLAYRPRVRESLGALL